MATNILGIRNNNVIVPYSAGSTMPAGSILSFAGASVPGGWALCDGSELSTTTYAELYARIGTTWNTCTNTLTGSANSAPSAGNFRLPDLRGVFLRNVADYAGSGAYNTANDVALGAYRVDQSQGHRHGTNGVTAASGLDTGSSWGFSADSGPIDDGTNGTPRVGYETAPKQVGVNYLIKLYDNLAAVDVLIPFGQTGMPGEVITALENGGVALSDGAYVDLCSVSLTKGKWSISALGEFAVGSGVTNTACGIAISAYSGNTTTDHVRCKNQIYLTPIGATLNNTGAIGSYVVDLTVTTTIYLKSLASFSGGNVNGLGSITATRLSPG